VARQAQAQTVIFDTIQKENLKIIDDYMEAKKTENNIAKNFQKLSINTLTYLSKHTNKNFKNMGREDVISFLNCLRKGEAEDPNHKWIGTYNTYLIVIATFFKWFYYPKMEQKQRPKPDVIQNLKRLKRKEKSTYKPSDMWTQDDDLLFLKYCPSKRDRCYHMMARDTSCRPSEILSLKIKDLVFKMAGDRQYAEILVNGKTGSRSIPLINSIPFVKDMLDSHPQKNNPNAYLIYSERVFGRRISIEGLFHMYKRYRTKLFPYLLKSSIDPNDKAKIRDLLKKPWNPYIRRHSALTEKSKILKEQILKSHAGWSPTSNVHLKYIHYFGNESSESILEAYGLIDKGKQEIDKLKPKVCPNCGNTSDNKPDSKFCMKCRMVLSYDGYHELLQDKELKQSEVKTLTEKYEKDMKEMRKELEPLLELKNTLIREGILEIS